MANVRDSTPEVHSARRLCELFRGRFSEKVSLTLIEEFGGEQQAIDFLLNEKEDVVSQFLKRNTSYVEELRSHSVKIADLLQNGLEYEIRQFACGNCTRSWWKKVPCRKQVAKCQRCHIKYDPVPHDREWGWGKFICGCGNEFHAYGEMGVTKSRCYKCSNMVLVAEILPPRRGNKNQKKSKKPHSCNGANCYNHDHDDFQAGLSQPGMISYLEPITAGTSLNSLDAQFNALQTNIGEPGAYPGKFQQKNAIGSFGADNYSYVGKASKSANVDTVCMHPLSQKGRRKLPTTSQRHISTGSTVNTFLTQGSLDTATVTSELHRIDE